MANNEDFNPLEMDDLLTEIIRALVDEPEHVKVTMQGSEANTSLLLIHTAPSDMGKVLGKAGETIKLIRKLFAKVAAVENRRVIIEIVDPRAKSRG